MSTKTKALIMVLFMVYGIIIGINIEPDRSSELPSPGFQPASETDVQEVLNLQNETEAMREDVAGLRMAIESLETERAAENTVLQELMEDVQEYQMLAGHKDVQGPGAVILLEGLFEDNIAPMVHQRKYLITLINELRTNGAEVVSVNGHRITGRSETTLAGNHIQVNGRPIAPPYEIKAIGDVNEYKRYVNARTFIFEFMESDGIVATISFEDNITIERPQREKSVRFLEVDRQ